ncbi:phosphogluconate dehydratase [Aliikangiella coralliicola]|uniref:Phosphogluconate dehydratase n=1 Tax=Aliikangiella coralliicola TaxID=2592383 RepID=A0A545UJQ0_9GAMM|nr:phosphogluconate dehydratase [Aliikangiella coralliicola]TQV89688.1 phosphogluconate dehydratase [Aliikangiella coralliicola]
MSVSGQSGKSTKASVGNNQSAARKEISRITQNIIEKSKPFRSDYLRRMAGQEEHKPARATLGCGNLAHGMAACSENEKKLLAAEHAPNLAIVNSYNDMLSAHQPYQSYPELIRKTAIRAGATAQVAGGVPAMCDGVTQGQSGMELSLFSRDLIAMATAVSLSHNMFDGVLCLGVCDKIVPGLLVGALSFGHLPTVFLPAGPMTTGQSNSDKAKVRQAYAEGKVGRAELLASESHSYHGPGTCTFYGTANSNQMLMEIMGLHLPGSSFVPPYTNLREALTIAAVDNLVSQLNGNSQAIPLAKIVSEKTIVNGIAGLLSTGGSTNHAIHLVAIARAAGIKIDWQDMAELSEVVPLLCRIYPNGSADINHFHAAGGMGFLMRELSDAGLLHQDVFTILGEGLESYFKEPELTQNTSADIYRDKTDVSLSQFNVRWKNVSRESLDDTVLRPANHSFSEQGGLKLLTGNLGRSVIKVSAVAQQHQVVEAPAAVFHSQEDFEKSFKNGELNKDFVAVIRFQGPKTNGMPELHKLTPLLGVQQDKGYQVAIVTDGRMSGASGKVPAAIHMIPEASDGGAISKIVDGDVIRLDAQKGELNILVDQSEFEQRERVSIDNLDSDFGVGRELFGAFRERVVSAELGASVF